MSADRWQRINDLFHAALEHDGPAREAFLRDACGADATLQADVLSLIAADQAPAGIAIEQLGETVAADWAATTQRPSLVGQRVDRYQVIAHLGSGGMGDVYRATDTVLGRDIALKVLTPALHADADFRRRLEQEARAASSLNHPNIVTVYEIGQSGSIDFVASELVDGMTVRERLASGPLLVREIVDIVNQVTAALSTAHAGGLVHRDIKPENVMIRRDGIVKLVDFGVAKRSGPGVPGGQATAGPVTHSGLVAGTACYMSPEQALGEPVDLRSDLFSVGILLYEMATGQRPFGGASDAAMYDALLHHTPVAPSTLRKELPGDLDLVIGRALEKEPDLRYQSAADLGADLKRLQRPSSAAARPALQRPASRTGRFWPAVATVALVVAASLGIALVLRRPADPATTRFTIGPPLNEVFTLTGRERQSLLLAVSPDGRRVAFAAGRPNGRGKIWVRSLDALQATPIEGTDGAVYPFWSPDGRSIGFFESSKLHRVDLAAGTRRTLTDAAVPRGGTWSPEGVILYGARDGIYRVAADGGEPTRVTVDPAEQTSHRFPQFLPDGRHFLYVADTALVVAALDDGTTTRLFETRTRVSYAAPGYLLFVADDGALMARPFDASTLKLTGEAVQLSSGVGVASTGETSVAVGGTTLAYAERTATTSQLTWFDRSGQASGTLGTPGQHLGVRLSPDGTRVAVTRQQPQGGTGLWLLDARRGVESAFTSGDGRSAVWSPDGSQIVFAAARDMLRFQMYQRPSAGGVVEARVFDSLNSIHPDDWSPDGRSIVYSTVPSAMSDLAMLRLSDQASTPLFTTPFFETDARISPDGRWLAYSSDETGLREVHVRPFPQGTSSVVVSIGGGDDPSWRRDGKELFYLAPNGALMAVMLNATEVVEASRPVELFRTAIPLDRRYQTSAYAVTADGQRFLVPTAVGAPAEAAVTVLMNWPATTRK